MIQRCLKPYVTALFLLWISYASFSQNSASYIPNIQHFTTLDGLSHRNVLCVFQGHDDVIWLGTQNGLNRFDGYRFKHWLGKDHGVDLKFTKAITQDDTGWLWIQSGLGYNRNLIFFNPKTEIFQTVTERFGKDCVLLDIYPQRTHSEFLLTDKNGTVFFHEVKENKIALHSYHSSVGFSKIGIPAILKDKNYQICYISEKGDFFIEYKDFDSGSGDRETAVLSLHKNALVLIRYENKVQETSTNVTEVNYENGQIWNISNDILSVYDAGQNLIISLDGNPIDYPRGVYFDKENRSWIYTAFGVYLIKPKKNQFSFFRNTKYNYRAQSVRGIIANSTEMTVAFAFNSVGKYHFKSKQWSYIKSSHHYSMSDFKMSMYASADGLWIGGEDQISLLKNEQLATDPMFLYEGKISQDIWCIFPSNLSSKKLWLGTEEGLFFFDTESKKIQSTINPLIKGAYHVQTIVRDKQHQNWLWLCSNKGLILFDEAKKEFLNLYSFNQSGNQFLPTDDVQHLYQDEEGIYWLATVDGVIRWNKAKNKYRQLTVANGLPANIVYAMYPDDYGNLWMSSEYGIIQMNKTTFAIKNHLPEDGIGQKEFNRVSHFSHRDENGVQRLFFGGLDGVTAFYPRDFQTDKQEIKPRLAILKYRQFDGSQKTIVNHTATLMATKKIIIQPNDYIHSLEVGLLTYNNVDDNQYRYQIKINGELSDWTMQKSRFIQVGQLPFGTHQLIITGNTQNNIPAKNDLTIDIIIRRPFYLTWWFVLIATATIVGSIFYYFNHKNSRLKAKQIELEGLVKERTEKIEADKTIIEVDKAIIEQQAEELKKIDATKSRFFANISHELRTPITLIQGPIQSALNSQGLNNRNFTLLTKAKQNTKKLLQLVNEILDLTKLDAHKLVLEETTVVFYPFLRSIISSFESIAAIQNTDLLFVYDIPKSLQIKVDKSKLEKILNNLLSNAFKFIPKNGKIIVHIQDFGNVIQMTVKDNGRGVPTKDVPNIFNRFYQSSVNTKAEGGLGIGLALSMEFVKLMKGKMWVESQIDEVETGSTFFVQFPKKEVIKMITTEEHEIINYENKADTIPVLLSENTPNNADLETILIVEDNYDLRDYLSYILLPHYNIITAENGLEGLEKLPTANCQLILSDVMMPVMDGFEFLERVKANEQWRGLPFIMLTARAEMQTRLNALRIGVDAYLLKPFDEDELLARVKNLLANYNARKTYLQEVQAENPDEIIISNEVISAADQKWLEDLEHLIMKEMGKSIFSNDYLADLLSISRNILYAKIKQLTGLTPTKYVRLIRLQKAKTLLEQGRSVKEVSYEVGFQKPEYFSKIYKKEFGKFPSE